MYSKSLQAAIIIAAFAYGICAASIIGILVFLYSNETRSRLSNQRMCLHFMHTVLLFSLSTIYAVPFLVHRDATSARMALSTGTLVITISILNWFLYHLLFVTCSNKCLTRTIAGLLAMITIGHIISVFFYVTSSHPAANAAFKVLSVFSLVYEGLVVGTLMLLPIAEKRISIVSEYSPGRNRHELPICVIAFVGIFVTVYAFWITAYVVKGQDGIYVWTNSLVFTAAITLQCLTSRSLAKAAILRDSVAQQTWLPIQKVPTDQINMQKMEPVCMCDHTKFVTQQSFLPNRRVLTRQACNMPTIHENYCSSGQYPGWI